MSVDRVNIMLPSSFTLHLRPRLVHLDEQSPRTSETTEQSEEEPQGELDGTPHSDERQIELDTDRSFVLYPVGEHILTMPAVPQLNIYPL